MTVSVAASYQHCQQILRRSSSNFAWSFAFLPREQRRAMTALYAFAREADDLADDDHPLSDRRAYLATLRADLERGLSGQFADDPQFVVVPALCDAARRFAIPPQYLFEILQGVEMDLDHQGFATFDELADYCYYVASAVGLACLHIWGGASEATYQPAVDCGVAFQLTNILRDLQEDAARGRVYLPLDDLARHGCDAGSFGAGAVAHEDLACLIAEQVERARGYYRSAARLEAHLSGPARRMFALMYGTYAALLEQIARQPGIVFQQRVRVPFWSRLTIARRALFSRLEPPGKLATEQHGRARKNGERGASAP
jgi:phytoene synthase